MDVWVLDGPDCIVLKDKAIIEASVQLTYSSTNTSIVKTFDGTGRIEFTVYAAGPEEAIVLNFMRCPVHDGATHL